ncbi:hypothetical protein OIU84_006839 [Salix udensis]|uniref:Uncharacterized protein n=1 Tax=Salix udensis TaxID=889485 RepID=A0AAD6P2P0_9ROSI|nr:hypothetical protein OIU84_006839 [Salix udensis]
MCVKRKPCFSLFVLLWLFVYHRTCFSIGVDTISVGQSLPVSQTLVSQNGIFELGFFPGTFDNIYLGIWYKIFADKRIVWVANRENPSNNPASSKLELLSDGNLVLRKNFTETVWSTALASSMPNTTKAEAPKDQADVYGLCGGFGVYGVLHENSSSYCECLKGFKPLVQNEWSSGCVRKSPLKCQNKSSDGNEDGFLKMSDLALPANSKTYQKVSAGRCRLDCIENCSCMAYAYNNNSGCHLWEGDLIDLQQSGAADGRAGAEIYIRLAASEPELLIGNGSTRTGGSIKWKLRTALAVAIPTTLITLGLFMYFRCLCKGKLTRKGQDIMLFDFDTNPGSTNNESSSVDNRKKRWSKNMELPLFSYESKNLKTV